MADKYTRQAQAAFAKGNTEQGRAFTQMAMTATQSRNASLQSIGSGTLYGGFRGSDQESFASRFAGGGRRGPLGHSVREGFRAAGMSGAGGEAGYAMMMLSDMGLAGGAIAVGVLAIAEGYKVAKEHAEKLREAQERHTESVREAAHFTAKLYQAPTTGLGEKYLQRNEELEKSNRDLKKNSLKSARDLGLGDTAVILGQTIWRGGLEKTDYAKTVKEDVATAKQQQQEHDDNLAKVKVENQRQIDQITLAAKKEGIDKELALLEQRREWIIADAKRDHQDVIQLEKSFQAERLAIIADANRQVKDKSRDVMNRSALKRADMTATRNHETLQQAEIEQEVQELRDKYAPNRGEEYRRQLIKDKGSGQYRQETIDEYRQRLYGDADKNAGGDKKKQRELRDKANESVEFEKNLDAYANHDRSARIADFARGVRDELKTTADKLAEYKQKLADAVGAEELTGAQAKLAEQIEEAKMSKTEGTFGKSGLWGFAGTSPELEQLKKIEQNTRPANNMGGPGVAADAVTAGNPEAGTLTMA
jgi:hypothetical protein